MKKTKYISFLLFMIFSINLKASEIENLRNDSFLKKIDVKEFKKVCRKIEEKNIKSLYNSNFTKKEKKVIKTLKEQDEKIKIKDIKNFCEDLKNDEKISFSVDSKYSNGELKISDNGDVEILNANFEPVSVEEQLNDDETSEEAPPSNLDYSQEIAYAKYYNLPISKNRVNTQANEIVASKNIDEVSDFVPVDSSLPENLVKEAFDYFNKNYDKFSNKDYIGVVDFSRHSSKPRFFLINTKDRTYQAIRVAHGSGSDKDNDGYATYFSNTNMSKASSLGFYLTGSLYVGKYGKSLKLHGLSSTNSNAYSRAVVIHPSEYVLEKDVKIGRSWGCLALSKTTINKVLNILNSGALIYSSLSR